MEKLNRDARRYLREIRGCVPCVGRLKRKVLEEIRGMLREFLTESPEADYDAIIVRFGTPQQIAATYVDEAETGELLKMLRTRRKYISIAVIALTILLSIWAAFVTVELVSDAYKVKTFSYEVEIIDDQWLADDGGNS